MARNTQDIVRTTSMSSAMPKKQNSQQNRQEKTFFCPYTVIKPNPTAEKVSLAKRGRFRGGYTAPLLRSELGEGLG